VKSKRKGKQVKLHVVEVTFVPDDVEWGKGKIRAALRILLAKDGMSDGDDAGVNDRDKQNEVKQNGKPP
jgi:hypothetical protein